MKEFVIRLRSVQDVEDFVALATCQPYHISVGDGIHQVDADSFMGVFCLNLTESLIVTANCDSEQFDQLRMEAAHFLV